MWPAATGWVYMRNPQLLIQGEGGTVFSHWLVQTRSFLCLPLACTDGPCMPREHKGAHTLRQK